MIELTVKTLDSQNHSFTVEDDITVAQFKEHIAGVVNIPTDSQRLIYCGRVLQDVKKLQEYDVNGKVIHLVQRAPPSTSRRSRSPSHPSTNTARRVFQGPVYLGSMALPSGIMEAQGIVPPPPTQSLSGSRLNVARRMLKRAENILNHTEDPHGTRNRESPTEEPQDDVTPVFAAQVFVPNISADDAVAAAVSAVENGILQEQAEAAVAAVQMPSNTNTESPTTPMSVEQNQESTENQGNQPSSSASTSSQNQTEQTSTQTQQTGRLPENSTSTVEMARLLDELNKIQERLRPFMQHFHTFMAEDPVLEGEQGSPENIRQTQTIINRVSEIMHLLGHAYHSLSDVMVQVNTPPPRPLLCRPILIQHSAVLQAGIPIQVEAQINLTPDRRPSENPNAEQMTGTTTAADSTSTTNTSTTSTTTDSTHPQPTITSQQIRPNVHEIRIDSFPIDFRNMAQNQAVMNMVQHVHDMTRRQQQQTNNNTVPQQDTTSTPASGEVPSAPADGSPAGSNPQTGGTQFVPTNVAQPNVVMPPVYVNNTHLNPNMEFFMEVTPESITIDSLETTVVTSAAQADNVLRGTFGGNPPEFLQSILQAVAGQMIGVTTNPTGVASAVPPPAPTSETTATTTATSEISQETTSQTVTSGGSARTNPNVNSQARGNTQTHPTTSTQTRSTARPHVQLAQHTMQGFDPFLPCNSHHIRRRRHANNAPQSNNATGVNGTSANATDTESQNNNQPNNALFNMLQGFLRTVGNHMGRAGQRERPAQQETATATNATPPTAATTATTGGAPNAQPPNTEHPLPPFSTFLGSSNGEFNFPFGRVSARDARSNQGTTIAAFLQNFPDSYVEGESIFTDLMMTLARGLTFRDIITLNTGQLYPLYRIRPVLRTFFRNRILQGECPTQPAIDRGAARLIEELQPMLEILNNLPVRDDIDIVQSVTQLFRSRFPCIISLVMSRMNRSLSCLVDQCILTVRHFCALLMYCSRNGITDVEEVFRSLITRYTLGITPDILEWAMGSSISQLRQFLNTLDIPEVTIQPYIVRRSDTRPLEVPPAPIVVPEESEPEAMEVEEAPIVEVHAEPVTATPLPPINRIEPAPPIADNEPLPNVVIGSEPWHSVTPNDWIPIITRDIQRQRRQINQQPFSDAYLSGMPSKRRKIVTNNKPQGNIQQIISESLIRAVSEANLNTTVPVETVAQAASTDSNLHIAYRELLRSRVQASLRDNPDFNPERFPNASNFFNNFDVDAA